MANPGQTLTIRDPGLGLSEQSENTFLFFGTASSGSITEVKGFNSPAAVVAEYGQGKLPEALCHALAVAGGPVYACRLSGTVAGTNTAVTKTAAGSSTGTVTLAGAPYDRHEATIEIMGTGTVAVGTFRYSLDGKRTYSETLTIPSGGTYAIPNTNITATFVPGAGAVFFQVGDLHDWTSSAPHYSSTELALGMTALLAYQTAAPAFAVDAIVLTGRNATGSGAATLFGALSTHLASQANRYSYCAAIMDSGSLDTRANVKTAFASLTDARISLVYGDVDVASSKPGAGWGVPKTELLVSAAARALRELISTDLARVKSGSLTGVVEISNNEFDNQDMDVAKISVSDTKLGLQGYFLTNMRMKSPTGSDYKYWQHRRIMDVMCRTVAQALILYLSQGFATNSDGTIEESEAKRVEAEVSEKIKIALMDPKNVEGRAGHISAFSFTVDRSNNLLQSETLQTSVAARPFGYAKTITTELGFAVSV